MRKTILMILGTLLAVATVGCNLKKNNATDIPFKGANVLVAYFSATGHTEKAARQLAALTNATLFEITPLHPYSDADIDYNDESSRCWVENRDPTIRPQLRSIPDVATVDVIFVGYPIWWDKAPLPVYTFIENTSLKGKTIIPFATSETSDIKDSADAMRELRSDVNWKSGLLMNQLTDNDLLDKLNDILKQDTQL